MSWVSVKPSREGEERGIECEVSRLCRGKCNFIHEEVLQKEEKGRMSVPERFEGASFVVRGVSAQSKTEEGGEGDELEERAEKVNLVVKLSLSDRKRVTLLALADR